MILLILFHPSNLSTGQLRLLCLCLLRDKYIVLILQNLLLLLLFSLLDVLFIEVGMVVLRVKILYFLAEFLHALLNLLEARGKVGVHKAIETSLHGFVI